MQLLRRPRADVSRVGPPGDRHRRKIARATGGGNPRPARPGHRNGETSRERDAGHPDGSPPGGVVRPGRMRGQPGQPGRLRLAGIAAAISPWSHDRLGRARRGGSLDRLPIFGWLGLRREAALHGAGFWVRPLLVELAAGRALPRCISGRSAAGDFCRRLSRGCPPCRPSSTASIFAHAMLIALMLVASLIDRDEKTIPDAITVPGTLLGLLLAAVCPGRCCPTPA